MEFKKWGERGRTVAACIGAVLLGLTGSIALWLHGFRVEAVVGGLSFTLFAFLFLASVVHPVADLPGMDTRKKWMRTIHGVDEVQSRKKDRRRSDCR